jgi:uncharacterized protein (TIGR00251 family)
MEDARNDAMLEARAAFASYASFISFTPLTTMSLLEISEDSARGTVTFSVRVQPRASKNEIVGPWAGALKVRLSAPAVENRANDALIEFLAELLNMPKSAVRIRSGKQNRTKHVVITGVTRQQVEGLIQSEA